MIKHFSLPFIAALSIPLEANANTCDPVEGDYEAVDSVCLDSPIGLCADGFLAGDLEVSYHSEFQTLVPAPTLQEPLRLEFTAEDQLDSTTGTLWAHTTGWIVAADTTGAAACLTGCLLSLSLDECLVDCVLDYGHTEFESTLYIYGGSGSWSNVTSGTIVAPGIGDYVTQVSVGTYSGQLCEE